jgi:polyhydroxyalkanoate depolymerase
MNSIEDIDAHDASLALTERITAARSDPAGLLALARALQAMLGRQVSHCRPDFRIDSVFLAETGLDCAVTETAIDVTPFCTLLHFEKEAANQPRVLVVAPMSGHYASQLRETVLALLPEHDVYLTDWHDAQQVPLAAGDFRLEHYTAYLMRFLERIGPDAHVLAICQSCVPALSATALLAEDRHWSRPLSLALLAGPIDARINPTVINQYATGAPLEWYQHNLISTAPPSVPGAGRQVYAGELQLLNALGMHWQRSLDALGKLWSNPFGLQHASLELWRLLNDDNLAMQDLDAEFYLENLRLVFRDYALPRGLLRCGERAVRPECISETALLTVEAEFDDVCGAGQTAAAQALCSSLPDAMKSHHLQKGASHKGLFTGPLWIQQVYPLVRGLIRTAENRRTLAGIA